MTIKELIEELKKFGEDEEICLSNDSEGNDIKTIDCITLTYLGIKKDPDEDTQMVVIYPTDTIINL